MTYVEEGMNCKAMWTRNKMTSNDVEQRVEWHGRTSSCGKGVVCGVAWCGASRVFIVSLFLFVRFLVSTIDDTSQSD